LFTLLKYDFSTALLSENRMLLQHGGEGGYALSLCCKLGDCLLVAMQISGYTYFTATSHPIASPCCKEELASLFFWMVGQPEHLFLPSKIPH